uniref:Uncharacterized protein n=1 Tax=Lactuca sativa TaxID=4236 RepID=A0A9R1WQB0_LACSA|nr:hypothetical protein LSAT_V11C100034740 [Lactuca sativa]
MIFMLFIQRLIPTSFHDMLPKYVWESLAELTLFFKTLTATLITTREMERTEAEIAIILCKLETICVPGIFNSMGHSPVLFHTKR